MKTLSTIVTLLFLSQAIYADTLLISITAQENDLDGMATWSCRALDQNGDPYQNKVVTAHAAGANGDDSFVDFTNSSGTAFFTYDPFGAGVDAQKGYDEIYCAILDSRGDVLQSSRATLAWRGDILITLTPSDFEIDPMEELTISIYLEDEFGDPIPNGTTLIFRQGVNPSVVFQLITDSNGLGLLIINSGGSSFPNTGIDTWYVEYIDVDPNVQSANVDILVKYKESLEPLWDLFADVAETYQPSCAVKDFSGNPIEGRFVTGFMIGPSGTISWNLATNADGIRTYFWGPAGGATPGIHEFICSMTDGNGEIVNTGFVEWNWVDLIKLDFKVLLAGPYNGSEMETNLTDVIPLTQPFTGPPWNYSGSESIDEIPEDMVDWILISIRSDLDAASELGRQAVLLLKDGSVVNPNLERPHFLDLTDQEIYLVAEHRNHLSAMTGIGVNQNLGVYTHNLSSQQAYGEGTSQIATGVYAMWGGDGDHNDSVTAFDFLNVWLPQNGGPSAYLDGDFNMDASVTAFDFLNIWLVANGIASQVPN